MCMQLLQTAAHVHSSEYSDLFKSAPICLGRDNLQCKRHAPQHISASPQHGTQSLSKPQHQALVRNARILPIRAPPLATPVPPPPPLPSPSLEGCSWYPAAVLGRGPASGAGDAGTLPPPTPSPDTNPDEPRRVMPPGSDWPRAPRAEAKASPLPARCKHSTAKLP